MKWFSCFCHWIRLSAAFSNSNALTLAVIPPWLTFFVSACCHPRKVALCLTTRQLWDVCSKFPRSPFGDYQLIPAISPPGCLNFSQQAPTQFWVPSCWCRTSLVGPRICLLTFSNGFLGQTDFHLAWSRTDFVVTCAERHQKLPPATYHSAS